MLNDELRYRLFQQFGLRQSDIEELKIARQVLAKHSTVIMRVGSLTATLDALDEILSGRVVDAITKD